MICPLVVFARFPIGNNHFFRYLGRHNNLFRNFFREYFPDFFCRQLYIFVGTGFRNCDYFVDIFAGIFV